MSIIKKSWKVIAMTIVLILVCDTVGAIKIPLGFGSLMIFPMVLALMIAAMFGPDLLKFFSEKDCKMAGNIVIVALAPFMARLGISAGANISQLVAVGPALLLQEFGNLGTILISLPVALLLGLKREAIGACYSINRDSNFSLTADTFGADAPETQGTFAVFVVGTVIGTVYMSLLASLVASFNVLHPLALGMASGVGATAFMAAATGVLSEIYPAYAEQILALGSASDMLTGITGVYMAVFIALPMTKKLYTILEPILGRKSKKQSEQ